MIRWGVNKYVALTGFAQIMRSRWTRFWQWLVLAAALSLMGTLWDVYTEDTNYPSYVGTFFLIYPLVLVLLLGVVPIIEGGIRWARSGKLRESPIQSDDGERKRRIVWVTAKGVFMIFIMGLWLFYASIPGSRPPDRSLQTRMILALVEFETERYSADHGSYPSGSNQEIGQQLTDYVTPKSWMKNRRGEIVDCWGTPLHFLFAPGRPPVIISAGKDKIFGTADDIRSDELGN